MMRGASTVVSIPVTMNFLVPPSRCSPIVATQFRTPSRVPVRYRNWDVNYFGYTFIFKMFKKLYKYMWFFSSSLIKNLTKTWKLKICLILWFRFFIIGLQCESKIIYPLELKSLCRSRFFKWVFVKNLNRSRSFRLCNIDNLLRP